MFFDPRAPTGGEREKSGPQTAPGDAPDARCLGRSGGGLTTKIHALVYANGLPLALKLTPGQAHDGRSATDMLGARSLDLHQAMSNRVHTPSFNPFLYRYRNLVERFFSKLKRFHAVAIRFEKHAENYLAIAKLAAIQIWLRFYQWVT
jgi:transposase